MKLFGLGPGYWLFWISAVYFVAGMFNIAYNFTSFEIIQAVYIVILGAPLFIKPLARLIKIKCIWESW